MAGGLEAVPNRVRGVVNLHGVEPKFRSFRIHAPDALTGILSPLMNLSIPRPKLWSRWIQEVRKPGRVTMNRIPGGNLPESGRITTSRFAIRLLRELHQT
jgi:hypothetical protein